MTMRMRGPRETPRSRACACQCACTDQVRHRVSVRAPPSMRTRGPSQTPCKRACANDHTRARTKTNGCEGQQGARLLHRHHPAAERDGFVPHAGHQRLGPHRAPTRQEGESAHRPRRRPGRWHRNVNLARAEIKSRNADDGTGVNFVDVEDCFNGNGDEECIAATTSGGFKMMRPGQPEARERAEHAGHLHHAKVDLRLHARSGLSCS